MQSNKTKDLYQSSLVSIAHCKLIFDQDHRPIDYIFEDVNDGFELFNGLKKEEVIGRSKSELFEYPVRVMDFVVSALEKKEEKEVRYFSEALGSVVKVKIIPEGEDGFMMVSTQSISTQPYDEETVALLKSVQLIFSSNTIAVSLIKCQDDQYNYLESNPVQKRWANLEEVHGLSVFNFYTKDQAQILRENFDKCLKDGEVINYEAKVELAHGPSVVSSEITPVYGKSGNRYILLVSKDITELRRVQRQNEILVNRFTAMFDQHSAMKIVFHPETGQIISANHSARKFYGYSEEEMLSMTMQSLSAMPRDILEETRACAESEDGIVFRSMPHYNKKGQLHYMDIYSSVIFDGEQKYRYSIFFDVTERDLLRQQLLEEKELLKVTLNSIGDGVVSTDPQERITAMNPMAEKITGWSKENAIGKPFEEVFNLVNHQLGSRLKSPVKAVLESGQMMILASNTDLIDASGKTIPIADSAAPIRTKDGDVHGVVMVFRDISTEKEYKEKIERLSYHDHLTGLYNRRYIEKIMFELDREENLPLVVVMADLNGLKLTNDVFGHEMGDELLKNATHLIQSHTQEDHIVARWGGDEFVIFMPKTTKDQAEAIMEKIKTSSLNIGKNILNSSISLGYAIKSGMQYNLDEALRVAEENMYHHKLLEGKSYRNSILNTLLVSLFENSNETEAHSQRLEVYSQAIGRKLGLSARELNDLSLLALLHDIGKIGVDSHILKKSGPLTDEEWVTMKTHPEVGYRVAKAIPELSSVANLILSHHEKWDGTGYPNNIIGHSIPLPCRILAVADAYDAMTSDRSYRKALSHDEAMKEIFRNSNTQFDPDIVEIFMDLMEEGDLGII